MIALDAALNETPELDLREGEHRGRLLVHVRKAIDGLYQRNNAPVGHVQEHDQAAAYVTQHAADWLREDNLLDEARAELEHGVETYDAGNAWVLGLRVDLVALARFEGKWDEAYRLLEECVPWLASLEKPDQQGPSADMRRLATGSYHSVRGEVDLLLGRLDRAALSFAQEAEFARATGDVGLWWSVLDDRIALAIALHDEASVAKLADEARAQPYYSEGTAQQVARLRQREGIALFECERRGESPRGKAVPMLRELVAGSDLDTHDRFEAWIALGKINSELGNVTEAEDALRSARAILDERSEQSTRVDPRRPIIDALHSRVVFTSTSSREERQSALASLEASFQLFLESWSRAPASADGTAFLQFEDRYLVVSELLRACLTMYGDDAGCRRALGWILRMESLGNLARKLDIGAPDVDSALAQLSGEDRGCLFLVPGRDRSDLLVADARGISSFEIPPDWKLRVIVSELGIALGQGIQAGLEADDPSLATEIEAFADAFLPRLARSRILGWKSVTLFGDELFGHLPLDCIQLDDGRRLGDVLPVSYAPSIPVQAALTRRSRSRELLSAERCRVRIVGAPTVGALDQSRWRPEPIEVDQDHWDRWSKVWPQPAEIVLGPAATRSAILTAGSQGIHVLQVLMHGVYDAESSVPAELLCSIASDESSGTLRAEVIERARMPRLVSLTVCGGGRSLVRRGDDGRASLAGAFAIGGADCVVLTPLDLRLRAAMDLFEELHTQLALGSAPAPGLCAARAKLRARTGHVPLQDYLVYAWGCADAPVVGASHDIGTLSVSPPGFVHPGVLWLLGSATVLACCVAVAMALSRSRRRRLD